MRKALDVMLAVWGNDAPLSDPHYQLDDVAESIDFVHSKTMNDANLVMRVLRRCVRGMPSSVARWVAAKARASDVPFPYEVLGTAPPKDAGLAKELLDIKTCILATMRTTQLLPDLAHLVLSFLFVAKT